MLVVETILAAVVFIGFAVVVTGRRSVREELALGTVVRISVRATTLATDSLNCRIGVLESIGCAVWP